LGTWVYKRDWKKKPGDPGMWPQSKKTEAVLTWMTCGSLVQTAQIIGVGLPTIKHWRKQPWWIEAVEGFHDDDKTELDAKYQKIIRKALSVVEDRLDNGNFQMDQKTGEIVRVPVSMSDTHRVVKDLVDQQQELRRDKKQEVAATETVNDKLIKLAEQFALMALGKAAPKETGETYEMELERLEIDSGGSETVSEVPEVQPTP
jgi:hypothetical protein